MHDTAIYLRKRIIGSIEKEPPRPHNPEVVGSNPAPATKNLQLGSKIASELFLLVYFAGELRVNPESIYYVKQINH